MRNVDVIRPIGEAGIALFGEIPYKHDSFIVHLTPAGAFILIQPRRCDARFVPGVL
jgi:hypothetical protein